MIARWEQGRAEIDMMIVEGKVDRVHSDRKLADVYLSQAVKHLDTAKAAIDTDPVASLQIAYDAARKALVAVMENQGLRPTIRGGHKAVEDTARAQLDPPLGALVSNFGWLRVKRHESEYPNFERPGIERADASTAIEISADIVQKAHGLINTMPVY